MTNKWRRYEVLLPLRFNDGRAVPEDLIAEAMFEIAKHFGAASYETQHIQGHWHHGGVYYRDELVKLVVDIPDRVKNRRWMTAFKQHWKSRLEQLELWMVSYQITVE